MNHNFLKLCNFNNLQMSISAVYESCVGDKQGGEIDKENKPPSPKEVRQPVVFHCYDCKRQFTRLIDRSVILGSIEFCLNEKT